MNVELLRLVPQVDELLRRSDFAALFPSQSRTRVAEALRQAIAQLKGAILASSEFVPSNEEIPMFLLTRTQDILNSQSSMSLRRVINGTGVLLHTNLGRAPLAEAAIQAVNDAARGYSTLEYDVASGERGSRQSHVRTLLARLTGAEDALVVNNNAAAVLLVLSALAAGREVVVSRGELVEIGGAFRIPEVIEQGGAILREVGTTNKTYIRDYERAINECTAALLKVHTSNYQVVGFTESVSRAEISALADRHGLYAIDDLGSGVLVPLFGEPTVQEAVASGVDIVTFSGDKLLGGPQAGIILGKRRLLSIIEKHPLMRALRIDKLTLAALEATLRLYWQERHEGEVPIFRLLTKDLAQVKSEAENLAEAVNALPHWRAEVQSSGGQVGGGSLPGQELAGFAVAIDSPLGCVLLERRLRQAEVPIVARIEKGRVLIAPRTLFPGEGEEVAAALNSIANEGTAV